jgi:hypothetical protein
VGAYVPEQDWSVQLKKIEREFDGLPPEPSHALKKLQSEEERRSKERAQQRVAMFGAGARLILVFALFAALALWPYANQCGWGLFSYVGVEAVIVAGGLWVAVTTWRYRLPRMHAFSLVIVLVGLVLIAADVLPRAGYANIDPKHPPQTWCPEATSGASTTTSLPEAKSTPATTAFLPEAKSTPPTTAFLPEAKDAPLETGMLEQRVHYAAQSLGARWHESSTDLVTKLRPQQASLARTVHRGLQLQRAP